MKDVIFVIEM